VGNAYQRTVTFGPELRDGATFTVTATATTVSNQSATDSETVTYVGNPTLLSVSAVNAGSSKPQLAIDGNGMIHVVWQDNCAALQGCAESQPGNLPYDIFHRMYNPNTQQWSATRLLSNALGDDDSRNPAIAADSSGNIHVVWQDDGNIAGNADNDIDIFHRIYNRNTQAWSNSALVSTGINLSDCVNPRLAGDTGGAVHLVFEVRASNDAEVFYAKYMGGWGASSSATPELASLRASNPDVAADSFGLAYVVWQDDGNLLSSGNDSDIFVRSVDGGSLGNAVLISGHPNDGQSLRPRIAMDSADRARVVWQDTAQAFGGGPDFDIFMRSYDDFGGLDMGYTLVSLHPNDGISEEVNITIDLATDDVYVAWTDSGNIYDADNDFDIYMAVAESGFFDLPLQISASNTFNGLAENPAMVYHPLNGVLHMVWEDESTAYGSGPDRDIFYLSVEGNP
jgi:hypothetical protein